MRKRLFLAALGLLAAVGGAPALADQKFVPSRYQRDCTDEWGRNLCRAKVRNQIVRKLGLRPAEEMSREPGFQFRIFSIDGSSRDKPALVFRGLGGASASIDVHGERNSPSERPSFSVELTPPEAAAALRMMRRVWRLPVSGQEIMNLPPRRLEDGSVSMTICAHAWVVVLEVIHGGRIVRRMRNSCQTDNIADQALRWSDLVADRLPQCSPLKGGPYGSGSNILEACVAASGDVRAAAEVRRLADTHRAVGDIDRFGSNLSEQFGASITVRTAVGTASGPEASQKLLAVHSGALLTRHVWASPGGEARLRGELLQYVSNAAGDRSTAYLAPVEARWVREGGVWRIVEVSIGRRVRRPS